MNNNNLLSSKEEVEIESDCNVSPEDENMNNNDNIITNHQSIQQLPQLPSQLSNNELCGNHDHDHHLQQQQHERPVTPHQEQQQYEQNIQHQNMNIVPNTPHLSHSMHIQPHQLQPPQQHTQQPPSHHQQAMYHQLSQSYDFSMNQYRNNNNQHQHQFAWSQPHPPQQNMHNPYINPNQLNHPQQWMQMSHNNNISHFAPQKLQFPSNSSSLVNTNTSTPRGSLILDNNSQFMKSNNFKKNALDEIKEMHEHETNPKSANMAQTEGIDDVNIDDEDDSNLFMPITPTLSDAALRALLSQLRRKCKTLQFKSKQQNKFIIDMRQEMNELENNLSNSKIKVYDQEQNILMLQHQDDMNTLEYLRGAELHQTRQELSFMMQKMNELQANNHSLKQQLKLQQLDHETYNKSLKEEYQRVLREINQHKVLFDQRGREIKELKESSNNEKSEFDQQLTETKKLKDENEEKLSKISEQLLSLRNDHEKLKKQYDETYEEKEKYRKSLRDSELQIDERDQNIISLKRVKENLEQEIDALSRSNRNHREIRDKSTSQLLESQQHQIESIKQQIAQQYDRFLEEERGKNEKLQQLLKEKNMEINELHNGRMHAVRTKNENDDYRQALERLEIENHELRKKLEEIQFGDGCNDDKMKLNVNINKSVQTDHEITNMGNESDTKFVDPYHCNSSTASSMDEFGMLMLKAAKEEVEQLRETNEKLMKLHAKNHMKKPGMQDQTTQTYDNLNHTEISTNSSFMTTNSVQTQKVCIVLYH